MAYESKKKKQSIKEAEELVMKRKLTGNDANVIAEFIDKVDRIESDREMIEIRGRF